MQLTPLPYALEQRKILSLNQALNAADEVIQSVFSSVGPVNSVKSFVSNALGGWTDQNLDKSCWIILRLQGEAIKTLICLVDL